MHLVGRYQRCFQYIPGQLASAPYLIDRKWGTLSPERTAREWWRDVTGRWWRVVAAGALAGALVLCRGGGLWDPLVWGGPVLGMALSGASQGYGMMVPGAMTTFAATTFALSATSRAYAGRVYVPQPETLNAISFYMSTLGNTGNNPDIAVDCRDNTGNKPGSALTGGAIAQVGSLVSGWNTATGFTASLAAHTPYWATIQDDNFSTSGGHTCQERAVSFGNAGTVDFLPLLSADTTDAWTTPAYNTTRATLTYKCASGRVLGNPFISTNAVSIATQKGLRVNDGLTEALKIFGLLWNATIGAPFSGVNIYLNADGPGGTPADAGTLGIQQGSATTGALGGFTSGASYTLPKATPFSAVLAVLSASSAGPQRLSCGTGAGADQANCMPGGGQWYWRQDTAGNWVDTTTSLPQVAFLVEDLVAGSGSSGPIRHSMRGGFIN